MPKLTEIKELVNSLSLSERQELIKFLTAVSESSSMYALLEQSKFANGIYCPKCGCMENIVKFGQYKGLQRYKCKDCNSTFTASSFSVIHKSLKPIETWERYIGCLVNGYSLRKSAQICQISLPTAFFWRHKILDALCKESEKDKPKLKGVIESDETFFRLSFKGSRNLPENRDAHHRGEKSSKRGLSREQVCVPCGLDRNGTAISRISNLGKISVSNLTNFYSGKVEHDSIFCTDSEKSYVKFAAENGYKLVQIKRGKHKLGVYHINHVNAFHSNLKHFMDKFRGVATKYLDNYLTWNISKKLSTSEVIKAMGSVNYNTHCKEIKNRPAVPVK